jgi:predicted Zn-dependent peptidase
VQEYVLSELDTGERLITERVGSVRSVSLGFWIGAGSRDETDARAGVTHFIEHLLFKGTRSYPAIEIAEIFDELGGELNAATSRESTVVFARVADRHLETALDVMADMVFSPTFADLETERAVVLEEIAMLEDTPQDLVHDLLSEAIFGGNPLGRQIIGSADVISSVSKRSLATYHRQMYTAGNIVLAAAGNLEHDQLLALLERASHQRMEPPEARTRVRRPLVKPPPPGLRFQSKETEQYHVCVGGIGVSRTDRRRFAASILDAILGGSASSRLFQEIREKRGMAYAVYSFASQYTDTGLVGIYVGTREENLEACFEIVAREIADIAAGKVTERELTRAKENLKGRMVLSMESTSNRMSRLGKSLITDTELLTLDRIIAEIDAVDAEEIAGLAAVLLAPETLSASGIGPSQDRFLAAVEQVHPGLPARAAA